MNMLSRRGFLAASGAVAAVAATGAEAKKAAAKAPEAKKGKLIVSPPMLQNAAETSMGIAFAVSDMANGYAEYSTSPDMKNAVKVKCGGYRVTDMNDVAMLVRLRGLKPATKYYYRIGADRIEFKHGYSMKIIGTEADPTIRSFTTAGAGARSAFAVINDTHNRYKSMDLSMEKVSEIDPPCVVWNGDATNCEETYARLVNTFLSPKLKKADYAAERPYLFVPGNHEYRGMANRRNERIWMFRDPEERPSRDWDLGRNFAFRQGDIAMIGLDTAEDKPDACNVFAGLFCSEPYRVAQAAWLKDVLERPDIKSAPYLVAFCHIPILKVLPRLNAGAWHQDCSKLWGPLLSKAGCQLVVTGHLHRYRYNAPEKGRSWAHIVGGGHELGEIRSRKTGKMVKDDSLFPTVVEGSVEGGMLKVRVHDVFKRRIAGAFEFKPRT